MNLYERDFMESATQEEIIALTAEKAFNFKSGIRYSGEGLRYSHPDKDMRVFLWHNISLFPNNSLLPIWVLELPLKSESELFLQILDESRTEQEIQRYIKSNRKWHIPASLYKEYNFGHHDAYLFPEQNLGAEYTADYMLLGKNSDGYSIVLIEFENPISPFMIASSNTESESVRKGLTQVRDWKRWLDSNRKYFLESIGLTAHGINVPTSRIFYCIAVSRRRDMNPTAQELRSQIAFEGHNLKIVSYDRLVDNIKLLYNGY